MGDRQLMIRDRALILRILVPGLETRLRDKVNSMFVCGLPFRKILVACNIWS